MAQILSIQDTHKLDYKNATVTARRYGTTTPIPFFQSDGTGLGLEVYINAKGYLCNSGGSLYTSGVFVHERAEITVTFKNGDSTSWIVAPDESEQIHDGKLYGEDPNNPGQYIEIFSANSENPGFLAWENILRKPSFNIWYETETVVKMTQADDTVDSSVTDLKFTKTMSIIAEAGIVPQTLTIIPDQSRAGQNISIRNLTGYPILLKNSDNTPIKVVMPSDAETDRICQVVLFGSGDHNLHGVGDSEFYPAVVDISNVGSFGLGVDITDATPDVVRVSVSDTIRDIMMQDIWFTANLELPIKCNNISERKVKIWLQNGATFGGITLTYAGTPLCELHNYCAVELVIPEKAHRDLGQTPFVTWQSEAGKSAMLPKATCDLLYATTGNAKRLPIGIGSVEVETGAYSTIDVYFDGKSQQSVFVGVHNTTSGPVTVRFLPPSGTEYCSFVQNAPLVHYGFTQLGGRVVNISRVGESSGTTTDPIIPDSTLKYNNVYDGSTLKLDLNYLVTHGWTTFGTTNASTDITLVVDIPDNATTSFTVDISPYMTTWGRYDGGQTAVKLAVPNGSGAALLYGLPCVRPEPGTTEKSANYIQPQRIAVRATRSGASLSFTTEVLP